MTDLYPLFWTLSTGLFPGLIQQLLWVAPLGLAIAFIKKNT